MFKRSQQHHRSHQSMEGVSSSSGRAGKATARKPGKRSFRDDAAKRKILLQQQQCMDNNNSPPLGPNNNAATLTSPIITLVVGASQRLFACHQDVLCIAPFFASALRGQFYNNNHDGGFAPRIELPEEVPEVFSAVLEYLYKGDYYPRLLHDKKRNTWALEDALTQTQTGSLEATVYHPGVDGVLLKDAAVYCLADKYGLEELKRLALRKQGLQTHIPVDVILRSARYAYQHTPDHDAKLRAHFLALIIRSRRTFKRSGTMQMEMDAGGSKLFFDLFVAMCNHIDDIVEITSKGSPKSV